MIMVHIFVPHSQPKLVMFYDGQTQAHTLLYSLPSLKFHSLFFSYFDERNKSWYRKEKRI